MKTKVYTIYFKVAAYRSKNFFSDLHLGIDQTRSRRVFFHHFSNFQ